MFKTVTLAMTGASGVDYGMQLLKSLVKADKQVYVLISKAMHMVFALESDIKLPTQTKALEDFLRDYTGARPGQIKVFANQDWLAPIASGSGISDAMVVCPCSSGSLASFAVGLSDNLIERAVDVTLKERKKLIVVHRETPLSEIHLSHMLTLTKMGAVMLPANPGFYHQPKTIDDLVNFVVARILEHLNIEHNLLAPWGSA